MPKESFIIYSSFYKPISILSDKQLGRLFRAIFQYNLGEAVDVDDDIRMAFEFFKNQFIIDERKYQSKIERDIENGRRGGNPNFKKGTPNPYYCKGKKGKGSVDGDITQDNPPLSDITQDNLINDNDNDNVNENATDNVNDNVNENADKKEKNNAKKKDFDFRKAMLDTLCLVPQHLDDWMLVRKRKGGVNSETAFHGIVRKIRAAAKHGLEDDECVRIAAERGWIGFDITWLKQDEIDSIIADREDVYMKNI